MSNLTYEQRVALEKELQELRAQIEQLKARQRSIEYALRDGRPQDSYRPFSMSGVRHG